MLYKQYLKIKNMRKESTKRLNNEKQNKDNKDNKEIQTKKGNGCIC